MVTPVRFELTTHGLTGTLFCVKIKRGTPYFIGSSALFFMQFFVVPAPLYHFSLAVFRDILQMIDA